LEHNDDVRDARRLVLTGQLDAHAQDGMHGIPNGFRGGKLHDAADERTGAGNLTRLTP
jgi:hypothetical protein